MGCRGHEPHRGRQIRRRAPRRPPRSQPRHQQFVRCAERLSLSTISAAGLMASRERAGIEEPAPASPTCARGPPGIARHQGIASSVPSIPRSPRHGHGPCPKRSSRGAEMSVMWITMIGLAHLPPFPAPLYRPHPVPDPRSRAPEAFAAASE